MEARAGLRPESGQRIGWGQVAAVIGAAALVGLGVGLGAHFLASAPSTPSAAIAPSAELHGQARWGPGARPAPAITTLRDQNGDRFSLASLRGHTVAMVFFDSHCHQECPLAGRTLAAAESSLPRAARPVLVIVSVNPLDTPASTRSATRAWGLAHLTAWHWLRGTHAQLARVWKAYKIDVVPEPGDISHTEALYLIDRRGDERSGYLYPFIPGFVARDLRTLAAPAGPAGHV